MKRPVSTEESTRRAGTTLPVSGSAEVRRYVLELGGRHRGTLAAVVALNSVAAVAGVVGPQILGRLVQDLGSGLTLQDVNKAALIFVVALLVQTVFTGWSRMRASVLGETILADLRTDFLERAVALPPGAVERAGTGDLVTRATTDVDRLAFAVRRAVPEIVISLGTAVLIGVALVLTSWELALAWLLAVPPILVTTRWYFRRAPSAYREEMAAYAEVNARIAETVDAGRTVEAYRLGADRVRRTDDGIRWWIGWERYTLWLRTVWFPSVEAAYVLPLAAVLALGGWLYLDGQVNLGHWRAAACASTAKAPTSPTPSCIRAMYSRSPCRRGSRSWKSSACRNAVGPRRWRKGSTGRSQAESLRNFLPARRWEQKSDCLSRSD